jgi:two-component system nitrate/nitrite response regulator NarL
MRSFADPQRQVAIATDLTMREREIARLVVIGLKNKSIADKLQLSEGTVKIHLHNIYRKLGIRNRMALLVQSYVLSI